MGKRIAITGLGVISSNGIGKEAFSDALSKGISGIKPISLFDTGPFKVKTAGEIKGFKPEEFLGPKGLRTLDRSTKLVCSAVKLALDDAHLEINAENPKEFGVVVGNTLGSLHSICDFDISSLKEGPRYVNPALFSNTVINSAASQVSLKFNIRGFNVTISTGFTASLDAVNYAVDSLKLGKAKIVLAGGVEELCLETYLGFYKTGFLAGLNGNGLELSCPFDKRRNGVILGEGAGILVLEDLDSAIKRQANIYAEVLGFGMGFEPYRIDKYSRRPDGLTRSMRLAMQHASLKNEDIDYISSAANSTVSADLMETRAIKEVFGALAQNLKISAVKSMLGECFSAAGALQAAAAVMALEKQVVPPTINYQQKDEACDLNYVVNKTISCKMDNVLINACGPSGCNSSLIISKFKGKPEDGF